jgi:hypothetical protein
MSGPLENCTYARTIGDVHDRHAWNRFTCAGEGYRKIFEISSDGSYQIACQD